MPSATGDRSKARGFSLCAANIRIAEVTTTNHATNDLLSLPAGSARIFVRGLVASMVASAKRLKAMAAERAATSATMIQMEVRRLGMPRAAKTAPVRPKGSVRTECSHLIISRVVPMLRRKDTVDCNLESDPADLAAALWQRAADPLTLPGGTVMRSAIIAGLRAQQMTRVPKGRLI